MALLRCESLEAFYGNVRILQGVDLEIDQAGITAILGANGAGKTTCLRALTGSIRVDGKVWLDGRRIDGLRTETIARLGVAHVPDGRGTFTQLTTEENLRLGAYTRSDAKEIARDLELVYTYFPKLKERQRQQAGTLSGGEQQMLAISRALMLKPRILLLDEPSFGLAPIVVREIYTILRQINQNARTAILVVEQNANLALDLAGKAYLLETGKVVMSGSARDIKNDEKIRRSYLGY